MKPPFTIWPVALSAFVLTIFVGVAASNVSTQYYEHYSYDPDPSSGLLHNIQAYDKVQKYGRWVAFSHELTSNPRDPLAYAPIILLAPALLKSRTAHLFVLLPYFFLFLFFLGYRVVVNHAIILAIAWQFSFATVLVIFAPYFGIGFHLPDAIASYPLALAGFSLLFWMEGKRLFWVSVFALMISLAVLTRYIFSVYAFAVFAPIIIYTVFSGYKKQTAFVAIKPVLIMAAIIALTCGHYIFKNFEYNFNYYTYWAGKKSATLNYDLSFSIKTFFLGFGSFFGPFHAVILLTAFGWFFFRTAKMKDRKGLGLLAIIFWFCLAMPFIWVFLLKSNGLKVTSSFLAAFPITFVAIAEGSKALPLIGRWRVGATIFIVLLSSASFARYYGKALSASLNASKEMTQRKQFLVISAAILNSLKNSDLKLIDLSSKYLAEALACEVFYRHGKVVDVSMGSLLFRQGGQFWQKNYSNTNDDEVGRYIFNQIDTSYHVVFTNAASLNESKNYETETAFKIASKIKKLLISSNHWFKEPSLSSQEVDVYFKMK